MKKFLKKVLEKKKYIFLILCILLCALLFYFFLTKNVNKIKDINHTKKQENITLKEKLIKKIENVQKKVDLEKVKEKYEDAKAWLYIPKVNIDEMIMKSKEDNFYLHHLPNKEYAIAGSLYMDNKTDENFEKNMVMWIFGHNMPDKETRFSKLPELFNQKNEKKEKNEKFYLYQNNKEYEYEITDAILVKPSNDLYPADAFTDIEDFKKALINEHGKDENIKNYTNSDKFVILSTCYTPWDSDTRYMIIGRLVKITKY